MNVGLKEVTNAVSEVRDSGGMVSLRPYKAGDDHRMNEYCVFFKPETTQASAHFPAIYQAVIEKMQEFGQEPSSCAVLGARFLAQHKIMQEHYGVIDSISRNGVDAMSGDARAKLLSTFGADAFDRFQLLGAHQFLREFPEFSAAALSIFYDNLQNNKLGGGTHCVKASVRGKNVILFNGFHPEQLEHYERDGSVIVVMSCKTEKDWKTLREVMTGSTNPQKAHPSSIRAMLLSKRHDFRISEVSTGRNGVHVSAGPLEGMVEIYRFLRNSGTHLPKPHALTFGQLLATNGFKEEQIAKLCTNPDLTVAGAKISAFDLTEEINAVDAMNKLRAAMNVA